MLHRIEQRHTGDRSRHKKNWDRGFSRSIYPARKKPQVSVSERLDHAIILMEKHLVTPKISKIRGMITQSLITKIEEIVIVQRRS